MWDMAKLKALAAAEARERNTSHEVKLAMTDFARMRGITYFPYDRSEARERLHSRLPEVLEELETLPRGVVDLRDELLTYVDSVREQLGLERGRTGKPPADKDRPIEVEPKIAARAAEQTPEASPGGEEKTPSSVWNIPPEDRPRDRDRGR
jgi:hypothetical protein